MMHNRSKTFLSIVLAGFLGIVSPSPFVYAAPAQSETVTITMDSSDRTQTYTLSMQDKRDLLPLDERKKTPATAALLSLLYPGLGQIYVGDTARGMMIMIPGTLILVAGIVGFGILGERPAEAATLGRLMILAVWIGGHIWNIRDAYNQAEELNRRLEKEDRYSWLNSIEIAWKQDTFVASYRISL